MYRLFNYCIVFLFVNNIFGQKENDYLSHLSEAYYGVEITHRITHQHVSSTSNVLHTYLVQTINNLDVSNAVLSIHTNQDGKLLKINNAFYPWLSMKQHNTRPTIDELQDVQKLAVHLGRSASPILVSKSEENNLTIVSAPGFSKETIKVKLGYYLLRKDLRLVWMVNTQVDNDWWDAKIDAENGAVLDKVNWVVNCNFDLSANKQMHSHTHTSQCITPLSIPNSFNVFPSPLESPIHGPQMVKTNPSNALASPFGWNDTNGIAGPEFTKTKGNNVEAKDDIANDNETTIGAFAEGGPTLDFNFSYTANVPVATNLNASLTNLFYWNNIVHDIYYKYGFTESAGNFQLNNYGKGGQQGDFVFADGLDGSGTNNANFGTPPDGTSPRMQMYKWLKSFSFINSPAAIAGSLNAVKANFGPSSFTVTNQVVQADPVNGCAALNNAGSIAGKIALIDRGVCEFGAKCLNAQNAGAIAVIVCNNDATAPFAMTPGTSGGSVTIPSVMISQAACNNIKLYLTNPLVNVTLTTATSEFDSSFDNGVIAHEYGHGISNRLTGGAANTGCLGNVEQMGEGWSDWLGLMLTIKSTQNGVTGRGIGNYLTTQDTSGAGIRPFPYSTNMTTNPHTYNSIKTAVAPHGVGSVWCAMLWEVTWAMIDKYGFNSDFYNGNGGNNKAMMLVIEGMKLQPCYPGFVDARDAILLADKVLYNGENQCLLWTAFAKRGLGFSATQGTSNSKTDGTEAFDTPSSCTVNMSIASNTNFATPGDTIIHTIKLKNVGTSSLTNIVLKDTLASDLQFISAATATIAGQVLTYAPFNLTVGDSITKTYTAFIKTTAKLSLDTITERAELSTNIFERKATNASQQNWSKSTVNKNGGTFSWYARNDTTNNEKYFILKEPIMPLDFSYMDFWHRYNVETNWDGGKVQVSTDNQLTWKDLGPQMLLNGYDGYLDNLPAYPAFSGNVTSFKNTVIDLVPFKGKYIYIRFWLHNDPFSANDGWYIDDIVFHNVNGNIYSKVYETNTQNKNVAAYINPSVTLVPCTKVYNTADNGQGSLRRAIACSVSGDQVAQIGALPNDTIRLTSSSIVVDKNLTIANIDSTFFKINSTHSFPTFTLSNNANVTMLNADITKKNSSNAPVIQNSNANLTLDGVTVRLSTNSPSEAIRNSGGSIVIKRNVLIKR